MASVAQALADGAVVTKRNLLKTRRMPDVLVWTTMSPIMFVLLFSYVFGSAIGNVLGGLDYKEFLMAGIFAQTVVFGATFTGASLADDMTKGIIDRFRSLPMSRAAVLIGRTSADVVNNCISLTIMSLTGLAVGWRVRTSIPEAILGFLVILLFAYAVSWIMAYVGLIVPSIEVVNNASFMVIFPMTFISNAFVPSEGLPGPLQAIAEWNPVSSMAQAAREAFGNLGPPPPVGPPPPDAWSLQNPILYTVLWVGIIMAIFVPLSIRQYKRKAAR